MTLDPAIAALAFPVVMLSLMGIAFTLAAMGGQEKIAQMSRRGSSLYLAILIAYTVPALVLCASDLQQMGLIPSGDIGTWILRTAAFAVVGVGAAWLLLLAELELALRLGRRSSSTAVQPGDERAEIATSGRNFAATALAFAVFEELLWRGIGVREIQASHSADSEALLIGSGIVLFGLCHMYFGMRAVLTKTLCGAVWCLLTVLSLGILPAIISHAAYQLLVARWNLGRTRRGGARSSVAETAPS